MRMPMPSAYCAGLGSCKAQSSAPPIYLGGVYTCLSAAVTMPHVWVAANSTAGTQHNPASNRPSHIYHPRVWPCAATQVLLVPGNNPDCVVHVYVNTFSSQQQQMAWTHLRVLPRAARSASRSSSRACSCSLHPCELRSCCYSKLVFSCVMLLVQTVAAHIDAGTAGLLSTAEAAATIA
jgi:hypothetical protein